MHKHSTTSNAKHNPFPIAQTKSSEPFFATSLPLPPALNATYLLSGPHCAGELVQRYESDLFDAMVAAHTANFDLINELSLYGIAPPLKVVLTFCMNVSWKSVLHHSVCDVIDATFNYLLLNKDWITDLRIKKVLDEDQPRVDVEVYMASA